MSNTNVQPESNKALDIGVVTLAVLIVAAGIFAFTFLTDQQLGIRIGESYDELRRVVWPTRRETVNTTGLVMAFVVAVAFYLFVVDKFVEWGLYDGLLRLSF